MIYTYAAVNALRPRVLELLEAGTRKYPKAWADAHHTPAPRGDRFVRLVARDCQKAGLNVGVNGKRGNLDDLSQDCLVLPVESGGAGDSSGRYPGLVIADIIIGAGTPSQNIGWIDQTGPTIAAGTRGGWVDPEVRPEEEETGGGGGGVVTPPPPVTTPPAPACQFSALPCKAEPCSITPEDIKGLVEAVEQLKGEMHQLFEAQTQRVFGADGTQGVAQEVIQWLQSNRVRVRF